MSSLSPIILSIRQIFKSCVGSIIIEKQGASILAFRVWVHHYSESYRIMRSRTVREGSVGLLILLGLGLLGAFILWLRNISLGTQSYRIIAEFKDASELQIGTPVRYRGVKVGRIISLEPKLNQVDVNLEITPSTFVIPSDVIIQSNQTGLLNEAYVDIIPKKAVTPTVADANPLSPNCPNTIICHNARIPGQPGVDIAMLVTSMYEFSEMYSNPQLYANLNTAAQSTATAAQQATKLTGELSAFLQVTEGQIKGLNTSVQGSLGDLNQTVNQAAVSLTSEMSNLSTTVQKDTQKVSEATVISATSVSRAAEQVSVLSTQVNRLLADNRSSLITSLENINSTTQQLSVLVGNLSPVINDFQKANIIQNLNAVSVNAAEASANLRDLTEAVSDQNNLTLIQETLNSARTTLETLQKISADVDELTGDPKVRENIRNLINGLGRLLGSTQRLEQQKNVSQQLTHLEEAVNATQDKLSTLPPDASVDLTDSELNEAIENLMNSATDYSVQKNQKFPSKMNVESGD